VSEHNHVTRDIKPLGKCPACDEYHDRNMPKPAAPVCAECGQPTDLHRYECSQPKPAKPREWRVRLVALITNDRSNYAAEHFGDEILVREVME
jgi:predicted amidophosphoribosyltransferase